MKSILKHSPRCVFRIHVSVPQPEGVPLHLHIQNSLAPQGLRPPHTQPRVGEGVYGPHIETTISFTTSFEFSYIQTHTQAVWIILAPVLFIFLCIICLCDNNIFLVILTKIIHLNVMNDLVKSFIPEHNVYRFIFIVVKYFIVAGSIVLCCLGKFQNSHKVLGYSIPTHKDK